MFQNLENLTWDVIAKIFALIDIVRNKLNK